MDKGVLNPGRVCFFTCMHTFLATQSQGSAGRRVKETQEDSPAQDAQALFHQPLGIHLRPGLCTLPQPYFSSTPGSKRILLRFILVLEGELERH